MYEDQYFNIQLQCFKFFENKLSAVWKITFKILSNLADLKKFIK